MSNQKECRELGQTFLTDKELEKHLEQHEWASDLFQCERRKASFESREALVRHILEVHGNRH